MSKPIFRDEHEDMAYAVICHYKYGSYGGMVPTKDIQRIGTVLRGRSLDPPKIKVTTVTLPSGIKMPVVPGHTPDAPVVATVVGAIQLPAAIKVNIAPLIKLP